MNLKLKVGVRAVPPGTGGNSNCRLLLAGDLWDEWEQTFCVHGEKLRWTCDACDDYFDARRRLKKLVLAREQPPT